MVVYQQVPQSARPVVLLFLGPKMFISTTSVPSGGLHMRRAVASHPRPLSA